MVRAYSNFLIPFKYTITYLFICPMHFSINFNIYLITYQFYVTCRKKGLFFSLFCKKKTSFIQVLLVQTNDLSIYAVYVGIKSVCKIILDTLDLWFRNKLNE